MMVQTESLRIILGPEARLTFSTKGFDMETPNESTTKKDFVRAAAVEITAGLASHSDSPRLDIAAKRAVDAAEAIWNITKQMEDKT